MEQTSLNVRHISHAATSSKKFIHSLRTGEIKSLKTSKSKFNKTFLNGLDWWRITTVAGLPGSGKSTFLSELRRDFIALNKDQNFEILSFEFEMRMEDQIARDLSSSLGVGLKEIYSSETPISEDLYSKIETEVENIALLPIFYVDKVGTARDITQTILNFAEVRNLQSENKGLVVTIDHTLLTKNNKGEAEKQRVDELYLSLVELKKHFSHENIKIMFVLLSQLNRDIQSNERVSNPKLHYPTQNDLFASSSAYQCSDYVVILHRPVVVSGMGAYYGPPRDGFPHGLPVIHPTLNKSMIYLHVIKERFGTPVVIACIEEFNKNQISERNPNE